MRKLIIIFLITVCGCCILPAQVTNYALKFEGAGNVKVNNLSELNNVSQFTFQVWLKPSVWVEDAIIFSQKEDDTHAISIRLGRAATHQLLVTVANGAYSNVILENSVLKENEWHQLTVVYNGMSNSQLDIYIDNNPVSTITSGIIPVSTANVTSVAELGTKFVGLMDEMRIWNTALTQPDFYFQNTVNKYHPNYSNLVAYWKFDQNLCPDIFDYKLKYHGKMFDAAHVAVTDNAGFIYRPVTGYASFRRFFDRAQINPEMYRMTNDLILLNLNTFSDGSAYFVDGPDCSGTLTHVNYLSIFGGRNGILQFNGVGAKMDIGCNTLMTSPDEGLTKTTFEAWVYIDQWVQGAYLFKKEASAASRFNILLGSEATQELIVQLNGYTYISTGKVSKGKWQHIAVSTNSSGPTNQSKFYFFFDGIASTASTYPTTGTVTTNFPLLPSTPGYIGLDFNGKMDEIMLWRTERGSSIISDKDNGIALPAAGKNLGAQLLIDLHSYWKADSVSNPGLDSYSWKNFINIMRGYYAGYRGYRIRAGLMGGTNWQTVLADPAKRQKMIESVAQILPYVDGIDMDFEWCYSDVNCWQNYAYLINGIKNLIPAGSGKILSVSPHPVSYSLTKSFLDLPDYFTFQNYGPSASTFAYSGSSSAYTNSCANFLNWGYKANKILLSVPTLATNGSKVIGYKDVVNSIAPYDPTVNSLVYNGSTYTITGVDMVKQRAQYVLDQNLRGIMYFDQGNDVSTTDSRSLTRAINSVIASNVDTLVTGSLTLGIETPSIVKTLPFLVTVDSSRASITLQMKDALSESNCVRLIDLSGRMHKEIKTSDNNVKIKTTGLANGIYLLQVVTDKGSWTKKVEIVK